jgi:anaerobic selenocysteine-containing dehydrogenase
MLTETAELADVVLPAATFLEGDDYIVMGDIGEVDPAIPPRGEAWPDWRIIFELARKMGLGRYFPWETGRDGRDAQYRAFRQMRVPQREGLATPSGKIELAASRLAELGVEPVPSTASVVTTSSEELPLTLVTGPRVAAFCNSQLRGIPLLEGRAGAPAVEVAPETAEALGVEGGGSARLQTRAGRLEVTVRVVPGLPRDLARIPHCRAELNANLLTDLEGGDPVSGFPNLRALPCSLEGRPR